MSVEKKNVYIPGQNITNLGNNVDYNRVADDKTSITVNFTGSPASVTIKAGSLIESNGNLYRVNADVTFTMGSVNDTYILFDDTTPIAAPNWGFSSSTSRGTFDPAKQGFYSGIGNTIKTLKWYIDQTSETVGLDTQINLALTDDMQLTADMHMANFTKFVDTLYYYEGTTDGSGNFSVSTGLNLADFIVVGAMRFSSPSWFTSNIEISLNTTTNVLAVSPAITINTPVRIAIMKIK